MRPRLGEGGGIAMYAAWIWCVGLLLPARERAEWRREWGSELWYVYRASLPGTWVAWSGHRALMGFCLGAFVDARSLRSERRRPQWAGVPYARSAQQCLGVLALLVGMMAGGVFALPRARMLLGASPYRDVGSLVFLSQDGYAETGLPSISVGQYRAWRSRPLRLFSEIALYRLAKARVQVSAHRTAVLSVASVTANLFPLLGVGVPGAPVGSGSEARLPELLLSDSVWRGEFAGDTQIVGRVLMVAGRRVRVAGIVSNAVWRLPSRADAWLVEPDEEVSALGAGEQGFVVARLSAAGASAARQAGVDGEHWRTPVFERKTEIGGSIFDAGAYECVAVSGMMRRPFAIFFYTVLLALLSLPATTSLPLGEYPSRELRLPWVLRVRRWGFLVAKIALVLPVVFFFSLDVAHLLPAIGPQMAQYVQMVVSFAVCLCGLRWALRDQRARCPVCLCRLTHPARVGDASRNFLGWNGMELMCADGHGLLHVPELETCWFRTQRWLYLDASWSALFVKST